MTKEYIQSGLQLEGKPGCVVEQNGVCVCACVCVCVCVCEETTSETTGRKEILG